jgi:hypothetical protein
MNKILMNSIIFIMFNLIAFALIGTIGEWGMFATKTILLFNVGAITAVKFGYEREEQCNE